MNIKPSIQRLAITVAATSAAMTGVAGFAIMTQPASTSAPDMTREVTYVDPAADEMTTTTSAPVDEVVGEQVEQAELAAGRAEVAATRAEVAAVKAETVVTSTTTSTMPVSVVSGPVTTTTARPILVGVTETTTSTTTVAKRWIEVGRIAANPSGINPSSPATPVDRFEISGSGELRVSNAQIMQYGGLVGSAGLVAIWAGDSDVPGPDACYFDWSDASPTTCSLPEDTTTISVGRQWNGRNAEPIWRGVYLTRADLVITEYR